MVLYKKNTKTTKAVHSPHANLENTRAFVLDKLATLNDNKKKNKKIETCIFNYAVKSAKQQCIERAWTNIQFRRLYLNKYRSILSNLKRDAELYSMSTKEFVFCDTPSDIAHEIWSNAIASAERKRNMMVVRCEDEEETGLYKCAKCKSKNTSFVTLQTRSADEPMTIFITCKQCDNRWKE